MKTNIEKVKIENEQFKIDRCVVGGRPCTDLDSLGIERTLPFPKNTFFF